MVAIITVLLSMLGLPWVHAALPHSPLHVRAMADAEHVYHDGRVESRCVVCRECCNRGDHLTARFFRQDRLRSRTACNHAIFASADLSFGLDGADSFAGWFFGWRIWRELRLTCLT